MTIATPFAPAGAPQATAKVGGTGPAIPGMEQGNPSVGRPAPPQAPSSNAPVVVGTPQAPQTPQQLRDQLRNQIRNSVRDGNPQIIIPPDFVRNAVPQGAVDISIAFFVTIGLIIVLFPFSRAMARFVDRRTQTLASGAQNIGPQIVQLQDSVDAMALELERITEAQRFQSKLLAGREEEPARLQR
jgi:hypothetical protein